MGVIQPGTFTGSGYWAVILGGSSGMGLASAQKLASEGMNLAILHRDRRAATRTFIEEEVARMEEYGIKVFYQNKDGISPDSIQPFLQDLAKEMAAGESVRLLLHSMSRGSLRVMVEPPESGPISEDELFAALQEDRKERFSRSGAILTRQDYLLTMEAMALSLFDWVKEIHGMKLFAEDARVLGLTSEGNQKAWHNYAAVSAAKASLEAISRSIALEFAPFGIRSNILQPGVTDTPSLRMIPGQEALKSQAAFRNPFSRLTTPEDVANAVYLMCRDEAAWINGAIIPVDGGEKNS